MNSRIKRFSRRFFIAISSAALIVACNQTQPDQSEVEPQTEAASNGQVNIYSSRHYNTDDELYDKFTEQTGIEVNLIEGKADELIERIKSEGANSPADILITVDAGRLWRAAEAGIFAPVESEVLEGKIPENLQDPDNQWFGFSKRARVIMYNKERTMNLSLYL